MIKHLPIVALSAVLVVATPAFAEDSKNHHEPKDHNKSKVQSVEAESGSPKNVVNEMQSAEVDSVQPKIDKEAEEIRKNIISDAVDAVVETNNALIALEQDKPDEAITAIKSAIGKLAIVLKRDPDMGLKPVHVSQTVHKLHATPEIIQEKIKAAEKHLRDGELQQARNLIGPLVSDITLTITSLPLNTYSQNIKSVVPLIDKGKIDEAKMALMSLLNTLVVKDVVTPIPPLLAEKFLLNAETLAEKENRTDEENETLNNVLKEARNQLKISELLGYGNKESFQSLYQQIDEIDQNTAGGQAGKGWFSSIKQQWSSVFGG